MVNSEEKKIMEQKLTDYGRVEISNFVYVINERRLHESVDPREVRQLSSAEGRDGLVVNRGRSRKPDF